MTYTGVSEISKRPNSQNIEKLTKEIEGREASYQVITDDSFHDATQSRRWDKRNKGLNARPEP